jgi:cation transport ATPase
MLPTDPKKAAEMGKAWGNVLADSIFGVTDVIRDRKGMKEAANKRMEAQNKMTAIKNTAIQAQNFKKQKEMEQQARDVEASMLARLSPKEREEYHQMRADDAKAAAKAKKQAEIDAQETKEMLTLVGVLIVVVPLMLWGAGFMFGMMAKASGDYNTYHMLQKIVPGL